MQREKFVFPDRREGGVVVLSERSEVKTDPPDRREGKTFSQGFFFYSRNFFRLRDTFFRKGRFRPLQKAYGYNALADLASNIWFMCFEKFWVCRGIVPGHA